MPTLRRVVVFLVFVLAIVPAAAQTGARPMTAVDQFAVVTLREIAVSPNGRTALFTATTTDFERDSSTTRLMRVSTNGGTPTPVDGAPTGASSLRWSPDGTRVAFFAAPDGRLGIYVLQLARGREGLTRVCDYDLGNAFVSKSGNALAWSPDGRQLAFAGTTEPPPGPADPIVVTRLQYKSRTDLSDDRRMHIHVVPATGGTPKALTSGERDEHSIDWGGDGREVVFVSNLEPDPDANHNYDIAAVEVASGAVRRLTDTGGVEMDPRVSPDGRWIAYTATTRALTTIDSVAEDAHLFVVPAMGGETRELNHAQDRRVSAPTWTADSRALLYTVGDRGRTTLHRISVEGGEPATLVDADAQVGPFDVGESGTIMLGLTDHATPRELYRLAPDGAAPERVSHLNDATLAGWRLVEPETVEFDSVDGTRVQGWLYPALDGGSRVPMILSIHGGPHGMYGFSFNAGFQVNAARGYATLAINPRGSSGYGQAFSDGTLENWGGGDYQDLMAGVDHVLATHPTIDPERLGVTGGSYGGFMTNWVITQTTRFKAAVSSASVSNLISFYATSLYQDLVHAEFRGFPWDGNFDLLWKWSPLAHVKNVTTPTLFVHGERDNDVHITQAEEMYTALRRRGVETVLVRYPREGHGLRERTHLLDRTERTLAWMDRYLKDDTAAPTAAAAR